MITFEQFKAALEVIAGTTPEDMREYLRRIEDFTQRNAARKLSNSVKANQAVIYPNVG